jgi:hypothetical protein
MTGKSMRLAVSASAVSALLTKTTTLQLFQKGGPTQFYTAAWKAVNLDPPKTLPVNGDHFDETDTDFIGTAASHAKTPSGSDVLSCTFTAQPTAVCDAQFEIDGSWILLNHFTINAAANKATVKITEGTGKFKGAHGTLTEVAVGNNAEITFTGV